MIELRMKDFDWSKLVFWSGDSRIENTPQHFLWYSLANNINRFDYVKAREAKPEKSHSGAYSSL